MYLFSTAVKRSIYLTSGNLDCHKKTTLRACTVSVNAHFFVFTALCPGHLWGVITIL